MGKRSVPPSPFFKKKKKNDLKIEIKKRRRWGQRKDGRAAHCKGMNEWVDSSEREGEKKKIKNREKFKNLRSPEGGTGRDTCRKARVAARKSPPAFSRKRGKCGEEGEEES